MRNTQRLLWAAEANKGAGTRGTNKFGAGVVLLGGLACFFGHKHAPQDLNLLKNGPGFDGVMPEPALAAYKKK